MCCFLALVVFSLQCLGAGTENHSSHPKSVLALGFWLVPLSLWGTGGIERAQLFPKDGGAGSCLLREHMKGT